MDTNTKPNPNPKLKHKKKQQKLSQGEKNVTNYARVVLEGVVRAHSAVFCRNLTINPWLH
jgi:hypothetical protein